MTHASRSVRRRPALRADEPPPAVIVGLDCITGLQTARLLDARGIPIVGVVADRRHFCARTRIPRLIVEAELRGPALVEALERLADRLPGPAGHKSRYEDPAIEKLAGIAKDAKHKDASYVFTNVDMFADAKRFKKAMKL